MEEGLYQHVKVALIWKSAQKFDLTWEFSPFWPLRGNSYGDERIHVKF